MRAAPIVLGLGFGDEGKGSLVDALVRRHEAKLVCRFNGGAQASHTVVLTDSRQHSFHQWGSGTFAGADTFLSSHVLFNPILAFFEAEELATKGVLDPFAHLLVDGECLVTTPYHAGMNQVRELARGAGRHGSCGLGIGETVADSIDYPEERLLVRDLHRPSHVRDLLIRVRARKSREAEQLLPGASAQWDDVEDTAAVYAWVAARLVPVDAAGAMRDGPVVFEGAQGVLLDQEYGLTPHHTWSDCTASNALALCAEASLQPHVIGVTRAYLTRHGAGPFPTEDPEIQAQLSDAHNPTNPWQGSFRYGWPDLDLLRYALNYAGRVDALAVTCLDQWEQLPGPKVAVRPNTSSQPGELAALLGQAAPWTAASGDPEEHVELLARTLGLPPAVGSYGPTAQEKRWT